MVISKSVVMRYIYLVSLFFIAFSQSKSAAAQPDKQSTHFEKNTLKYIHLDHNPISFYGVHSTYNLEEENGVFRLHFTPTVKTSDEKPLANNTDTIERNYERARLVIGLLCANDLKIAFSSKEYTENYRKEIRQIRDSVFHVYNTMFNDYYAVTENGHNVAQQQKWENYLLLMLSNKKNNSGLIGLKQDTFATIGVQNPELFYAANHFVYLRNRIPVIEDDFDNNENGWVNLELDDSTTKDLVNRKIGDGVLTIENGLKAERTGFALYKDIDYSKDFEIEVSLKIKKSKRKYSSAAFVFWGMDTTGNLGGMQFSVDRSGALYITFCKGGDHKKDIGKHAYAYSKKNAAIIITIRKVADKYYFFSGEKLVKTLDYLPLSGNGIYLVSEAQSSVAFDYFNFYYLEK